MLRSLICSLFVTAFAAFLWQAESADADQAPGALIGLIYNQSGSQAQLDIPSSRGARLALRQINQNGGLLGQPVQWSLVDGRSDAKLLRRKTAELIKKRPSTSALIGLSDTDMVLAVAPVAERDGRILVTSGATSPRLPAAMPGHLFLACFGDNVQAAVAAEWSHRTLSARTAVILFNDSMSYTQLLQGYFSARFEQLGGRVLARRNYVPGDQESALSGLPQADMIFMSAGPGEAVQLAALLRAKGITAPIVGGDGLDLEKAWLKQPNMNDVYFTTHVYLGADNPDPVVRAFHEAYLAAYPNSAPDAFSALGYDTARLISAAIVSAGSADPSGLGVALSGIDDFKGVTGKISYAGGSAIPKKTVSIVGITGGKRRFVAKMMPAVVPPP